MSSGGVLTRLFYGTRGLTHENIREICKSRRAGTNIILTMNKTRRNKITRQATREKNETSGKIKLIKK